MFEIENCYRIIFEAMLEDSVFLRIAERIEQYTEAGVAFVGETGKILACSRLWSSLFPMSAKKKHLTLEDYAVIYDKKEAGGKYWCIAPVYAGKMVIGHVILVYEKKEEKESFQELSMVLAQNVKRHYEEEQRQYVFNQPLKEHMAGWMLFEGDIQKLEEDQNCPEGKYILVLFCKEDGRTEEMVGRLHNIWNYMYIYEEEDEASVLLYQVKDHDISSIYAGMETEKIICCISEVFSKISLCRNKKNILERIAQVESPRETADVRREKEWSMRGMYTYTSGLIKRAGLNDYSIAQLILEDEKNNTELYNSLRTYLLYGNNVTIAAKKLHIHRNTLVYRLKQIKECINADINDYEVSRELLAFIMMNDAGGRG